MPDKRYRSISLELDRSDGKGRVFPASLSSEEPVERSFGFEILEHTESAVDLSRAKDGLPLLLHHDPQQPVGMVENVRLLGPRLRADVRFFTTHDGDEALRMVREGLRSLSIGYQIDAVEPGGTDRGVKTFRVKRWMPFETSLVTIPADRTVGIGRQSDTKGILHMQTEVRNEADRLRSLVSMGNQFKQYLRENDVQEAIDRGTTVDQFREFVMSRMETKHTDTRDRVGMSDSEISRYSLGRAVQAAILGDWSRAGLEREASKACEKRYGLQAEGFFVPPEYWKRDFNVGTAGEAGNLVATELRPDLFVDALRNELVIAKLGMKFLPGLSANIDIPRKATASSLGMLTEIQAAGETNPATAKVTLTPKRIGAYVEYSKQALIQSAIPLESMLRDDLMQGAAVLLENQVINGDGAGANIRGIRSTSGIGSVVGGVNGAALAWSHILDLESACANVNASPNAMAGYLLNTKTRAKAKNVQRAANLTFIIDPDTPPGPDGMVRVNGYRTAFSNTVPSNLTKGTSAGVCSSALFSADWSMGVVGLFGAPDIVVDPYTLASTAQVRITLNHFVSFGCRQAAAFAVMDDLLTT
jgi:HK97 family phage major capsid protein